MRRSYQRESEAAGRSAYLRGHDYVSTRDVWWRRGWRAARAEMERKRRDEPARGLLDEAERRLMAERAENMKRGGGGRWTVLGR